MKCLCDEELGLAVAKAVVDARAQSGITQKALAERTGIAQGDICKLEKGGSNPSVRTLQRIAVAMGMKLEIRFLPTAQS